MLAASAPWRCGQTGDCCRITPAVRLHKDELTAILDYRPDLKTQALPWRDMGDGFLELKAAPCPLLTADNRCSVYPVRPYVCRRFLCFREPGEAFVADQVNGCQSLTVAIQTSRNARRQYAQTQRTAQRWALAHGWSGDEA